ncbi:hypothetical protein GCM10009533_11950 [Saccharopolyspora spinosporotrichia]|uniref:Uncharacterized protein n=1 Tax=Saccharopolyspora erythraea TaxID=1836 RepID=A0ABN1C9K0_SACER
MEPTPSPSIARQPSQNADDIGARFAEVPSFRLEMSTTGVPKYRIPGSSLVCVDRIGSTSPSLVPQPMAGWR